MSSEAVESLTLTASAIRLASTVQQGVGSIGANPTITSEEGVEGSSSDGWITRVAHFGVVEVVALIAVVSAGVSFFFIEGVVVDLTSVFVAVLAPIVVVQKCGLRNLGGLRGQHNRLRTNVQRLQTENKQLHSSMGQLQSRVKSLSKVESDLQQVAKTASTDTDRLVHVVTEQNTVHKEMKVFLTRDVIQDIMTAVMQVDQDHDFTMTKDEVKTLRLRLESYPGIVFNAQRFQEFTTTGSDYKDDGKLTLANVLTIARNIQDPNIPDIQRVLRIEPKQLLTSPTPS